jgi:phenylacetate-coenzyme A ligase PaaK-like adenylate-forming protein
MSSEEITKVQEKKMREFIRFQLYPFSPYYQKLFDENGIDPKSIQTLQDLEKIPLTRKEDIMPDDENPKKYKEFILQPDLEKITKHWPRTKLIRLKLQDLAGKDLKKELSKEYYPNYMIATSGTTGNNVPFMYSLRDVKQFSNAYASVKEVVGMEDDWVIVNTFPFAPHLAFVFAYWVNVNSTLRFFHTGGGAVTSSEKTLDVISVVDANVLLGIPSYIYHLLRKAEDAEKDLSSIKMILTAGEKLTDGTRMKISKILEKLGAQDVQIFDVFGTTEMRDAYPECTPGSGVYHIHPNIHIAEIVDPKTGKQKRPGRKGALAITNIDGRGSVICRFLIGDLFEGVSQDGR